MMVKRSVSLSVAALLLLGLCVSLQTTAQEPGSVGPKAVAPKTLVDLGKHARGSKVRTEFEIQNQGNGPLMVLDTASSCSCLILEVDPVIAPGESGILVAEVDTEVLEGPARTAATILTNDPTNPKIQFEIRLESEPYLAAKPPYFHFTAHQGFKAEAVLQATVLATNPPEFSIESVESTYPGLTVEYREAEQDERIAGFEGPQYRVVAELAPDSPVGPLTGFVRVHTRHEKQKLFSIPISGFVRPVVAVTPPRMDLGTFSIAEDQRDFAFTVRVQHFLARAEDLQIAKIETDLPNLQTRVNDGATDHDWWVDMWWSKEQAPSGKFSGTVTIHTTNEMAPVVVLEVEGERV